MTPPNTGNRNITLHFPENLHIESCQTTAATLTLNQTYRWHQNKQEKVQGAYSIQQQYRGDTRMSCLDGYLTYFGGHEKGIAKWVKRAYNTILPRNRNTDFRQVEPTRACLIVFFICFLNQNFRSYCEISLSYGFIIVCLWCTSIWIKASSK